MERVQVNGISVRVALSGPADAPAVVLSNSLGADLTMWDPQAEALARDYRVIRFDARGHGETGATAGDYTLDLLADDVLALMDALGVRTGHFIGLSLGGLIGQVLGARAADRFASLILCATFGEAPPSLWADRIDAVRREGVSTLVEGTIERWFTPQFRTGAPATVDRVRRMIAATSPEGYMGCAAAIRDMDLTGVPERIRVPTLLVGAGRDPSASPEAMLRLQARIPASRYAQIDEAAHLFTLERPEEATELMVGFLAQQRGGAGRDAGMQARIGGSMQ